MSTSIAIKTESSDHYNFSVDVDLTEEEEVIAYVTEQMGEEAAYICDISVVLSNGDKVRIGFDFFDLLDE